MHSDERSVSAERRAWLAAALIITLAYHPLTLGLARLSYRAWPHGLEITGDANWYRCAEFCFGFALAIVTPRASGFTLGHPFRHWIALLCVTVLPLAIIANVYPRLPERPFAGYESGFWLLSAPAQELVYTGFLYGRFERLFSRRIFPRLDVPWAVQVTALFFSLWHLQNFASDAISARYVAFQLAYTFVGGVGHALIRYWTGSLFYPILMHMAVNWIAVRP